VKLSKGVSTRILLRSLCIQGAWNFKGMQTAGYLYAVLPGLKTIHGPDLPEAVMRHTTFFNTQPYMAPTVMGINLNLEEQGRYEMIPRVQPTVSGTLAAIGDSFFWATLKPLVALLCLLAVMFDAPLGIIVAILFFNIVHFWIMIWGFHKGYQLGPEGAFKVGAAISVDKTRIVSYAIPVLCGLVLALAPWGTDSGNTVMGLLIFLASYLSMKLKLNSFIIFYGLFILVLVWSIMK